MKKTILLIAIVIQGIIATGQTYNVLDTSYVGDQKLRIAEVFNERLYNQLVESISREKIANDTVLYLAETRQYYNQSLNLLNQFKQAFLKVDTIVADSAMVESWVTEFNELTARIDAIKNDADIENETTISEYKQIVARRQELLGWYRQVQAQQ